MDNRIYNDSYRFFVCGYDSENAYTFLIFRFCTQGNFVNLLVSPGNQLYHVTMAITSMSTTIGNSGVYYTRIDDNTDQTRTNDYIIGRAGRIYNDVSTDGYYHIILKLSMTGTIRTGIINLNGNYYVTPMSPYYYWQET